MKKEFWLIIVLALIIFGLIGVLFWPVKQNKAPFPLPVGKDGLQINNLQPNQEISSPLKITGVATEKWGGFEGQVGNIQLLDYKNNVLGQAPLTATTDWTKPPVNFEVNLNFTAANSGPATLVFHNENPSGDPARDKTFSLQVQIK